MEAASQNGVPDPDDLPPKRVSVSLRAAVSAVTQTQGNFPSAVHAEASITKATDGRTLLDLSAGTVEAQDNSSDPNSTSINGSTEYLLLLDNSSRSTEIIVPWVTLKAKAILDSGRKTEIFWPGYENYPPYVTRYWGTAFAQVEFGGSDTAFQLNPSPDALALMDCAHPELSVVNQYVMNGAGGAPFTIGCSAALWAVSALFNDQLRNGFNWEIERAPLPMLTIAPNGFSHSSSDTNVWRRSYPPDPASPTPIPGATPQPAPTATPGPTPAATPLNGMGFDTRGGLPASNDAFGLNKIFHRFTQGTNNQLLTHADIALFYDVTATTHTTTPPGPPGYDDTDHTTPIPTPNWFYYYSQSYTAPCPIQYTNDPSTYGYYLENQPLIRLSGAHGTKPTVIFRKVNNVLKIVGRETVRGIDTYARVLAHENAHKGCYEAIHGSAQMDDLDGDKVPDDWETSVGLTVQTGWDSTNFVDYYAQLGGQYDPGEGDSETFARMYEEGVFGNMGQDWADDGLNHSTSITTPPNRCERTKKFDENGLPVSSFSGTPVSNLP